VNTKKAIYIFLGLLCVGLGFWGIILPGLPTTIFLLMATYFFAKSSPRLHAWLLNNRLFGPFIKDYQEHQSIFLKVKIRIIITMWVMIGISFLFLLDITWLKILVPFLGVVGTVVVGFIVKTRSVEES